MIQIALFEKFTSPKQKRNTTTTHQKKMCVIYDHLPLPSTLTIIQKCFENYDEKSHASSQKSFQILLNQKISIFAMIMFMNFVNSSILYGIHVWG